MKKVDNIKILIVVDMQVGALKIPGLFEKEGLVKKIKNLVCLFREHKMPIIYIKHNGEKDSCLEKNSEGWEITNELIPSTDEIIIEKNESSAFHSTSLKDIVTEFNSPKVYVTGIQTEACVDSTFRHGVALEIDINLVKECHSTWPSMGLTAKSIIEHHNNVVDTFFERLVSASNIFSSDTKQEGKHG